MQRQKPQGTQAPQHTAVRKKGLVDGNTVELAQKLGLSLEDYVHHVVRFFLQAQAEPALYVIEGEDRRATGSQEPLAQGRESERQAERSALQRKAG